MHAREYLGLLAIVAAGASACAAGDSTTNMDVARRPDVLDERAPDAALPDVPPTDAVTIAPRCGDDSCNGGETCMTCPLDCNRCPTCDRAPSCTGALAVPTSTMPLAGCDNTTATGTDRTNYACGMDLGVAPSATTCADPKLRIRVREMAVQRGVLDIPRQMYCTITAEDGVHSELLLTPPRDVAGNHNTTRINLPLASSILWGQGDLYRSIANVTITYACFLTSDGAAAQRALDDIANRATAAAEHADGYGWVFGTVAVLSTVLGSSLGTLSDTQVLDVQQTIAAGALLPMTNGRAWSVHSRHGNFDLSGAADVTLTLESWGCADVRASTP